MVCNSKYYIWIVLNFRFGLDSKFLEEIFLSVIALAIVNVVASFDIFRYGNSGIETSFY